jgi:6-phosphogluconolactonase (cycloisomerase 2 family)
MGFGHSPRARLVGLVLALGVLAAAAPAAANHLTFLGAVFDGSGGADGLEHVQDLFLSPDGLHVYVASEEENSVAVYSRDATTAALTFVQKLVDGVGGVDGIANATGVVVSPDGKHVYVTGGADTANAVAAFSRDAVTGLLTFIGAQFDGVGGVDGLAYPVNLTMSPDGKNVYVAAYDDSGVSVFSRDAATGALTFVEAKINNVGGVTGLIQATTPVVSPDGKHLYVTAQGGDSIAVFSRDVGTGALTFVEALFDNTGGIDGLWGAYGLAVSPDGANVYVGGYNDHSIVTFDRDSASGALLFTDVQFDGNGPIDGLNWPLALAVSDDGTKLYVAGSYTDHALAVFDRNPATGALSFLEVHKNGVAGVQGLVACNSIRTSPDGKHVYTASRDPGALAIFATPSGIPPTTTSVTSSTTTSSSTTSSTSTTIFSATSTTSTTSSTTTDTTLPGTTTTVASSTTSTSVAGSTTTSSTTSSTTSTLPNCTSEPRSDCRLAAKVRFSVHDKTDDTKDRLRFQWKRGAATASADFGQPLGGTSYRLCVYRERQHRARGWAAGGGTCGGKPCWKQTKKGFRYADRSRTRDGIASITLKGGPDHKAGVSVSGVGTNLPLPAAPFTFPLVVQLQASDAACWGGMVFE